MSTLSLLQDWNASEARAHAAEEARRAALTSRQRKCEDLSRKMHKIVFLATWLAAILFCLVCWAVGFWTLVHHLL